MVNISQLTSRLSAISQQISTVLIDSNSLNSRPLLSSTSTRAALKTPLLIVVVQLSLLRNLLPSSGRCLPSHYLPTGLQATIYFCYISSTYIHNPANMFKVGLVGIYRQYSDGLWTGRPGFDSRQCKIFLFATASRPASHPKGAGGSFSGSKVAGA
jgi:hypothetical protein